MSNRFTWNNSTNGFFYALLICITISYIITIDQSYNISSRPHLDSTDITYDKLFNDSFKEKFERIQYSATLIITGAIKGTSRKRLFKKVCLAFLIIEGTTANCFSFIR